MRYSPVPIIGKIVTGLLVPHRAQALPNASSTFPPLSRTVAAPLQDLLPWSRRQYRMLFRLIVLTSLFQHSWMLMRLIQIVTIYNADAAAKTSKEATPPILRTTAWSVYQEKKNFSMAILSKQVVHVQNGQKNTTISSSEPGSPSSRQMRGDEPCVRIQREFLCDRNEEIPPERKKSIGQSKSII